MIRKRAVATLNIVMVVVGVAALSYSLHGQWQRRPPVWPSIEWPLMFAALGLAIGYSLAYGIGWHLVTRLMGIVTRLWVGLGIWGYSLLGKYVPGSVVLIGYRLGAYALQTDANPQQVMGALVLESALSVAGGLIVLCGAMAFARLYLTPLGLAAWHIAALAAALVGIGAAALLPAVKRAVCRLLRLEAHRHDLRFAPLAGMLLYYIGAWLIISLSFWVLCRAFGLRNLPWTTCGAIYVAAGLMGILSVFTPSGAGVREGVMVALLAQTAPLETAVAIALASRLASILADVCAIVLSLAQKHLLTKKVGDDFERASTTSFGKHRPEWPMYGLRLLRRYVPPAK